MPSSNTQPVVSVTASDLYSLQTMSGLGINVVRTWGFCNGCGANSIQTAVNPPPFPFCGSASLNLFENVHAVCILHATCKCVQIWFYVIRSHDLRSISRILDYIADT